MEKSENDLPVSLGLRWNRASPETAEDSIVDAPAVMRAWTDGAVVRSSLLELVVEALTEDPALATISGYTEGSCDERWTVEEAVVDAVPQRTRPSRSIPRKTL